MYATVTRYVLKPDKMDDARLLSKKLLPAASVIPGLREMLNLQQESGAGLFIMIYDSKAAAQKAWPAVNLVWNEFAQLYESEPESEAFDTKGRVTFPMDGAGNKSMSA